MTIPAFRSRSPARFRATRSAVFLALWLFWGGVAGAEILVAEDFEDADLPARGWYDIWSWGQELLLDSTTSVTGATSLQVRYQQGSTGPSMRHRFAGQGTIYTRYYRKWAPNWVWPTGSGPHDTYVFAMYGQQYFPPTQTYATVYTDSIYQGAPDWQFGTIGLLTRRYLQGESYVSRTALDPPPPRFELDRWYCIETLATMNTPGFADGVLRVWLDGVPIFDLTNVVLRDAANSNLQFDQFMFGPYFHGGTPQTQSTWIDALVIATDRVGCAGSAPSGPPPPDCVRRSDLVTPQPGCEAPPAP